MSGLIFIYLKRRKGENQPVSSAERFGAVEVSNLSLKELRDLLNDICGYQRFLSHLSGHEIPG
jgi:hypothetical protein